MPDVRTISKLNINGVLFYLPQGGGGGGTSNYPDLSNKPRINGVELTGNKTAEQLGINVPSLAPYRTAAAQDIIDNGKADVIAVSAIEAKIPSAASSDNQLADKAFVNSTVGTNTAIFRGTFNSVAALEAYSGEKTNNDYAFVIVYDPAAPAEVLRYDRYKTDGTTWSFEFSLNNSSFTAAQWAAIQSGITAEDVALIGTAVQPDDLDDYALKSDLTQLQKKITRTSVTLAAASWANKAQTVTVQGVLADETAQLIQPVPAAASMAAYYDAGVLATGQAANSLTFSCDTVPTADLTVYVVITEVSADDN